MEFESNPLVNRKDIHNFELFIDGHRSFIDYLEKGDKFYLVHTEVAPELEGRGVAAALVEKVFRYLEENKFKAVPLCPYIRSFLKRHPEWSSRVIDSSAAGDQ